MSACAIDGCDKPVFGHGWCSKHYTRWRRHGDPTKKHRTRAEEFWRRVDPVDEPNVCWIWKGHIRKSDGYGAFCYQGDQVLAHRESYELNVGPVPECLQLDHLCRNRACVRPDHLEAVTQAVNIRRGISGVVTSARIRSRTHCPQGHPYAGDNLIIVPRPTRKSPERRCRACSRAATARSLAKKKKETIQ